MQSAMLTILEDRSWGTNSAGGGPSWECRFYCHFFSVEEILD